MVGVRFHSRWCYFSGLQPDFPLLALFLRLNDGNLLEEMLPVSRIYLFSLFSDKAYKGKKILSLGSLCSTSLCIMPLYQVEYMLSIPGGESSRGLSVRERQRYSISCEVTALTTYRCQSVLLGKCVRKSLTTTWRERTKLVPICAWKYQVTLCHITWAMVLFSPYIC